MTQSLININQTQIDGKLVQTVNARDLHAFLEIGKDFSNWIKDRIRKYEFTEGSDYLLTSAKIGERQNVVLKEYHLTLDMAKELAMVERNEKGKQARQYFIECERRAKQVTNQQFDLANALEDPLFVKKLLLESVNKIEILKNEVNTLKPKAIALDGLKRSDGLFCITEAAKILEIRPKDLSHYLQAYGWVYRRAPGSPLLPYQEKIQKGLMDCPVITVYRPDGTEKTVPSAKITSKGITYLREQIYGNTQ
ncbi:phage antirepressor Ant [Bartonella rattaustraliani]|uniref:phage antirepressor Ant n=1 Tax=Bartonella rattaustraliani TaxID=481139 RepID=UPI00030C1F20|nr:phage antirepressor Ant [Bartonella rattaustraliani]